eukprot:gene11096-7723_t
MEVESICGLYSLTHLNGKKAPASATLCMTKDGDSILTYVLVSNVIKGKVKFENGRLTGMLLSGMSAGDKNQMTVEDAITGGFGSGFDVRKDLNRLLLKNENNALIFMETIKMEEILGSHAVVNVDNEAPKKPFTLKLTKEGGSSECVITASLGVPLRGNCKIVDGALKAGLEATIPDADDYLVPMAKKIITGFQNGFQVKKNDTGLLLKSNDGNVQLRCIIGKKELKGEYLFKSMDGAAIASDQQMFIAFSDDDDSLTVQAQIANRMKGSASLEQNVLRSDGFFAATRMMGSEQETKIEKALTMGMSDGFTLSLIGNQLTMKGPNTFVLVKVAHVDAALGSSKLEKDDQGKFVVETTIEPEQTVMFISGSVNGFKMLYSAEPLDSCNLFNFLDLQLQMCFLSYRDPFFFVLNYFVFHTLFYFISTVVTMCHPDAEAYNKGIVSLHLINRRRDVLQYFLFLLAHFLRFVCILNQKRNMKWNPSSSHLLHNSNNMQHNDDNDKEAQACKDALIAEARSIQKLLLDYQRTQEALKKDVDGFVKRDLEEDERGAKLYTTVAKAELQLSQNVAFLKFAKEKDKSDCVIPTRRMRDMGPNVRTLKSSSCSSANLTMSKIWDLCNELDGSLPSASVQLRDFSDLVEVLMGWRGHDKHFLQEAQGLCDALFSRTSGSPKYVCCSNGIPMVPHAIKNGSSPPFTDGLIKTLTKEIANVPFGLVSSVVAQVYQNTLLRGCQVSKQELLEAITSTTGAGAEGIFPHLIGDTHDNLTLVDASALQDTQLFRGFFFRSELRVVEHLGPEVDVMPLLTTPNNNSETMSNVSQQKPQLIASEIQRLRQTFCNVFAKVSSNNKLSAADDNGKTLESSNVCLILAVRREPLGESCHQHYILLDFHPISPALPFHWQLSWEELCAVGQRRGDPSAPDEVLLKYTKVSASELNPYDDASKAYFPNVEAFSAPFVDFASPIIRYFISFTRKNTQAGTLMTTGDL